MSEPDLGLFAHQNERAGEAVQRPAIGDWLPIEAAPRDNARLLYLARFSEDGELQELDYAGVWEYWSESWEMPHINGYAWFSANGIEEPTHWAFQDGPPPAASGLCATEETK